MKRTFLFLMSAALFSACSWTMNDQEVIDTTLPNSHSPQEMIGDWLNGYNSLAEVNEAYTGRSLGSAWQAGKLFKVTPDGRNSEFCFLTKNDQSATATKVSGTVRFDSESTNSRGSFTFLALKGHYKSWGAVTVDRDATTSELKKNLTRKYYYRMDGEWLRIETGGEPTDFSTSFRKIPSP